MDLVLRQEGAQRLVERVGQGISASGNAVPVEAAEVFETFVLLKDGEIGRAFSRIDDEKKTLIGISQIPAVVPYSDEGGVRF